MKKLGLVLGAAAVVTLAGCKDPNFKRNRSTASSDEVKSVVVEDQKKDAPKSIVTEEETPKATVVETPAPAPVAPPPPPAAAEPETTVYIVQPGDYISKISKKYNIKISAIKELNNLKSDKIFVGQKLLLPGKIEVGEQKVVSMPQATKAKGNFKKYEGATVKYTVKSGDFLGKIAAAHGINVRQLKAMNNLSSDSIRIGQKLDVPAKKGKVTADNAVKKEEKKDKVTGVVAPVVEQKVEDKDPALQATDTAIQATGEVENADVTVEPAAQPQADSLYKTYLVKDGESINDISASFGLVPGNIRDINNLGEDGEVQAGQVIKLPASATQE